MVAPVVLAVLIAAVPEKSTSPWYPWDLGISAYNVMMQHD